MRQQAVQSRYADIVKAFDTVAKSFGRDSGLLGYRQVTCAGRRDNQITGCGYAALLSGYGDTGNRVVANVGLFRYRARLFSIQPGDQDGLPVFAHCPDNPDNLLRRLSATKDHLRNALAQRAVMIDLRIAKVLKRLDF